MENKYAGESDWLLLLCYLPDKENGGKKETCQKKSMSRDGHLQNKKVQASLLIEPLGHQKFASTWTKGLDNVLKKKGLASACYIGDIIGCSELLFQIMISLRKLTPSCWEYFACSSRTRRWKASKPSLKGTTLCLPTGQLRMMRLKRTDPTRLCI